LIALPYSNFCLDISNLLIYKEIDGQSLRLRDPQPLAQHFPHTVLAQIEADRVAVAKDRIETAGMVER